MSGNSERSGLQRAASDSLTERLRESLRMDSTAVAAAKPRHSSATPTGSSSSSSTDSMAGKQARISDGHSGEILPSSVVDSSVRSAGLKSRPGHRRSMSAGVPLFFPGKSFGNITGGSRNNVGAQVSAPGPSLSTANHNSAPKPAVLGSGTANYGHGSIMRGGSARVSSSVVSGDGNVSNGEMRTLDESILKKSLISCDPEEVKKGGNEMYRRGNFVDALALYDRAISMSPRVASYRSNRAAALLALGRLGEAVKECKEAIRLDSGYLRAHQRLASLYLRLVHLCYVHIFASIDIA